MIQQKQPIIPVQLVGQNPSYQVLREPNKPAYPNGNEVKYSDDFLARLNEQYSIKEILGKKIETLAQRKGLEHFVMDSPLQNTEGEDVLAYILINSAQAKEWQPFIVYPPMLTDARIDTARDYLEKVAKKGPKDNDGMINGGLLFGLAIAIRGQFAIPTEYDNKVIVIPSQTFVEYISKQK